MNHRVSRLALLPLLAVGVLRPITAAEPTAADRWPSQPVRVVVPYSVGGAPDVLARVLGQKLSAALGQPVVVDNRAGAGGNTGADSVAKSPPDGYSLLLTTTATHSINPTLFARMPYHAERDFTPVAMVATTPVVLVVANDVKAATLRELVALAKQPGSPLTYASAGPGTVQHMAGAMFTHQTGAAMTHVPYKGTGALLPDLVAGRVALMFNSVAAVAPMVKDGKLRALAVSGTARSAALPDVPTFAEAGMKGFEPSAWYAVFGPAGLKPETVARLNAELRRAVASPEVQERYATLGLETSLSTPEELAARVRSDTVKWAAVIKAHKIALD